MSPRSRLTALVLTSALGVAFNATGCLSSFDTDSVELNTPDEGAEDVVTPPDDDNDADQGEDAEPDLVEDETNPDCVEDQACTPHPDTLGVCSDGVCVPTGCETGFLDCNDDLDGDGCEINGENSVEACGTCEVQCEGLNSNWLCVDRQCVVDSCVEGFADHNEDPDDGCETPVPEAIEISSAPVSVNHGLRINWRRSDPEVTPHVAVRWTQQVDDVEVPQLRIFDMLDGEGIIGPVLEEGPVSLVIQGLGLEPEVGQPIAGPPSEPRLADFVPQGWFSMGINEFFMDAKAVGPRRGFALTLNGGYFTFNSGRFLVPTHIPVDIAAVGFDMLFDGPGAGVGVAAGFGNNVFVTHDTGVTWRPTPVPGDDNELNTFRDAALTRDGQTLFAVGTRILDLTFGADEGSVLRSTNQGDDWSFLPEINPRIRQWNAMDIVETEDGERFVFIAGSDSSNTEGIVAVSGDLGDTWVQFSLLPNQDTRPNDINDLTMLDPQRGYITCDLGLLFTDDGWESSSLVALPQAAPDAEPMLRVRFDDVGRLGVATGFNGLTWTTLDGGDTWTFETDLINTLPDFGYTAVSHVPGSDSFLLFSNLGSRKLWIDDGRQRRFIDVADPELEDMIGIVAWDGLSNLRAFTEDGTVLRGFNTPDTLVRTRTIRHDDDLAVVLNAAAGNQQGDFIVIAGENGLAQFSTDNGDSWFRLLGRLDPATRFNDVAMSRDGGITMLVGNQSNNENETGTAAVIEVVGDTLREVQWDPADIDPAESLRNHTLVDVAVSGDGRKVAILAQSGNGDKLFIGTGISEDRSWERVELPERGLQSQTVAIRPDGDIWVSGDDLKVTRIFNGTLSQIQLPSPPISTNQRTFSVRGIFFPNDANVGWVTITEGYIATTLDGGDTWTLDKATSQGLDGTALNAIVVAPDNKHAIGVGRRGTAVWTANGGLR